MQLNNITGFGYQAYTNTASPFKYLLFSTNRQADLQYLLKHAFLRAGTDR
jgi:hypothetical protein